MFKCESTAVESVHCKVCGQSTEIQGCVDSGRSCEVARGTYMRLSGEPIYYHRCLGCGFIFTVAFDTWTFENFRRNIYNEGYAAADPDYADGTRARANATLTQSAMAQIGAQRVLDYGGGDGTLASELLAKGLDAHSWDPVADKSVAIAPTPGSFDLVTAFEVFEHTPTPVTTAVEALSFLRPNGLLLFSTLLLDDVHRQATDHWYIAPRNGHISLHTTASLGALFAQLGWTIRSFTANLHVAESLTATPAAAKSDERQAEKRRRRAIRMVEYNRERLYPTGRPSATDQQGRSVRSSQATRAKTDAQSPGAG